MNARPASNTPVAVVTRTSALPAVPAYPAGAAVPPIERALADPDSGAAVAGPAGEAWSYSGGGYGQREMFTATCDGCGGEARVPYQPSGSKPVYCSACYSTRR